MARVTILLPCYNVEKFIDICIMSLLAQTYKDISILAYDDCSEDSTLEHLHFWQEHDSRIFIKQPFKENVGYIHLLNRMMLDADSKYICRQDADDWSLPRRIEIQQEFMDGRNDAVLCGTQGKNVWEATNKICIFPWERDYVNPVASYETPVNELIRSEHRIIHGSMCMKTEYLLKSHGYDENLEPLEDWDLTLRLSSFGHLYVLPEVLYIRRLHGSNVARDNANKKRSVDRIVHRHNLVGYEFKSFRSLFVNPDLF
jgi:glycosyltransferase involved in cell wall biosynthesis